MALCNVTGEAWGWVRWVRFWGCPLWSRGTLPDAPCAIWALYSDRSCRCTAGTRARGVCHVPGTVQKAKWGMWMGAGGRGGCCSCPWTTQLGHGCVGIPWPSPVEVQPCHPAALDRTPKRRSKDVNRRGEKKNILKRMYHLKAKITPGQTDGDTNPLTSPLSLDSPNRCLRYVTCFYTAWPKTSQRLFFAYLHSNGRVQTSTALKFNKQARRFKRVARRTHY